MIKTDWKNSRNEISDLAKSLNQCNNKTKIKKKTTNEAETNPIASYSFPFQFHLPP